MRWNKHSNTQGSHLRTAIDFYPNSGERGYGSWKKDAWSLNWLRLNHKSVRERSILNSIFLIPTSSEAWASSWQYQDAAEESVTTCDILGWGPATEEQKNCHTFYCYFGLILLDQAEKRSLRCLGHALRSCYGRHGMECNQYYNSKTMDEGRKISTMDL